MELVTDKKYRTSLSRYLLLFSGDRYAEAPSFEKHHVRAETENNYFIFFYSFILILTKKKNANIFKFTWLGP